MRALSLNLLIVLLLSLGIAGCKSQETNGTTATEDAAAEEGAGGDGEETAGIDEEGFSSEYTPGFYDQWEGHYAEGIGSFVIYFGYDQSAIPQQAYAMLKAHAQHIADTEKVVLKLEGHADERGTREYNVALSERRAKAVERFLRIEGAPQAKMEVVPYGEEKPVKFGHDEESWQENRRVELNYIVGRPD